jgi:AbrB family transcriptional regulator (stage V sporulation protein T)
MPQAHVSKSKTTNRKEKTMKATGIVRRIDDLGRVVIPKEIRRTMRIREGDPLEIYTDREGEVIFKKYSPIGELTSFATQYAETLHKTCGLDVVICDRDAVVAAAGVSRKEYTDRKLTDELESIIETRQLYKYNQYQHNGQKIYVIDGGSHYVRCAMPILSEGDIAGCVISVASDDNQEKPISDEIEIKLIQSAASFLGKQLES